MTTLREERKRFSNALARLRVRFASAARAYEKDDNEKATDELTELLNEMESVLDDHFNSYPAALREKRLGALLNRRTDLNKKGRESLAAGELLSLLLKSERALYTLNGEFRRAYPSDAWWEKIWRYRKYVLVAAGLLIMGAGLSYWLVPRHGLFAEYYEGTDFQKLKKRRIDRAIDFDWGFAGPLGMSDHFSVRWTGYLLVPRDGTYEFIVRSDDGARLWINDKPVVDHWDLHAEADDKGTITLEKGPNTIRLDYFEYSRKAVIKLMWRPDGDSDPVTVPVENFAPTARDLPRS